MGGSVGPTEHAESRPGWRPARVGGGRPAAVNTAPSAPDSVGPRPVSRTRERHAARPPPTPHTPVRLGYGDPTAGLGLGLISDWATWDSPLVGLGQPSDRTGSDLLPGWVSPPTWLGQPFDRAGLCLRPDWVSPPVVLGRPSCRTGSALRPGWVSPSTGQPSGRAGLTAGRSAAPVRLADTDTALGDPRRSVNNRQPTTIRHDQGIPATAQPTPAE